ncbi:glutamine-hydrolyzing GMP synthase [Candidatus Woesebacteria bacterium]|nr:glutamine-hydrolyzing GMP synthase [Candidatus Woesebacteria bacterium]
MIIMIDFGSQTAHLIGRRLRDLGVTVEYAYPDEALEKIKTCKPSGVIFSGGPDFVDATNAPTISMKIFELGIPILGICYGWQLISYLLGGEGKITTKEFGPETLHISNPVDIFQLPKDTCNVIVSHGYTVTKLPPGFVLIASTERVKNIAAYDPKRKLYGIQYHPEANHTEYGVDLLKNFARDVCGETIHPTELNPQTIIDKIKKTVGKKKVICAVSGGVDSTVTAFLIGKAIGKQLIPVYVDSGLMRPETDKRVEYIFTKLISADLEIIHAKKRFLKALAGITDPEKKRKTIGKLYIDIFNEVAAKQNEVAYLAQGTIYSDVIESKGSKHASHIKSHHNVGGLPKDLNFTLLEPMRTFYKDEVRMLGKKAGLPDDVVNMQPFPGPGYAVRIRGEVTEERLAQEIQADTIVVEEIRKAGLYKKLFQCFAIMTGAYSTAVKGDERAFAEVVGIRAYESVDVMTSQWAKIPYDVLQKISSRIVNEVPNVSRVVYDITTKPPATMEWE